MFRRRFPAFHQERVNRITCRRVPAFLFRRSPTPRGRDKPHEAIAGGRGRDGVGLQNIGLRLRVGDGGRRSSCRPRPFAAHRRRTYMQVSDQTYSPGAVIRGRQDCEKCRGARSTPRRPARHRHSRGDPPARHPQCGRGSAGAVHGPLVVLDLLRRGAPVIHQQGFGPPGPANRASKSLAGDFGSPA